MTIWIFEDDDDRYSTLTRNLECDGTLKKITLKRYKSIVKEMEREGIPDVIMIDATAIIGDGIQPMGCWEMFSSNLRYFAKRHVSSRFVVFCAVLSWAKDFAEDIKEEIGDEVFVEVIDGNIEKVAEKIKALAGVGKQDE